jgi:hypothetical protein
MWVVDVRLLYGIIILVSRVPSRTERLLPQYVDPESRSHRSSAWTVRD